MDEAVWGGGRRYVAGAVGGWILFLAILFAIVYGRAAGLPAAALIGLALIPPLIAAAQFRAAWRSVAGTDEYVRALTAKRLMAAGGAAMTVMIALGAGRMAGLPDVPAWIVYPLFWGFYGVVTPLIRDSRA